MNRSIELGLNHFESARAYSDSESYYGKALRDRRKDVFLTSKPHARDRQDAFWSIFLKQSLTNMSTIFQ
ncbi:MAG: aldo/keto reductase [Desulfomonilaceae bacterium]